MNANEFFQKNFCTYTFFCVQQYTKDERKFFSIVKKVAGSRKMELDEFLYVICEAKRGEGEKGLKCFNFLQLCA
jgi:hypothetical protein